MSRGRVVCAMSGGVDSSVAAALLHQQGYEVIGVTMEIWPEMDQAEMAHHGGCCSIAAVEDARRVCDQLGIPHYVLNLRERFQHSVIDEFRTAYLEGRTPNPCIACNRKVKFSELLDRAQLLGADHLATGHYARVRFEDGRHHLLRAQDRRKDQTYVLYGLSQPELSRVLFPVGEYEKPAIREIAREVGFDLWDKPDSQEICFVSGDYRELVRDEAQPARFVDTDGRDLGEAPGVPFFTVGQRRGIGLVAERPYYVLELRARENVVVLGHREDLLGGSCTVSDVQYTRGLAPSDDFTCDVRIRAHGQEIPATVRPLGDIAEISFHEPQSAIAPGQAAVFYQGEECLGGGTITAR